MFFRNLTLFRFSKEMVPSLSGLDETLAAHTLRSVGPLEYATRGFVSPLGIDAATLTRSVGDAILFTLGVEEKLLPSAVINAEVDKRRHAEEERTGHPIGGRRRRA